MSAQTGFAGRFLFRRCAGKRLTFLCFMRYVMFVELSLTSLVAVLSAFGGTKNRVTMSTPWRLD